MILALRRLLALVTFVLGAYSFYYSSPVLAGGFMLPHQSARALALSSAINAGVSDASAVY
ncbi:MAG: hypothetical protein FJ143_12305 [Deltaproteobacteria bacterium]|nr:hypothetical protein [Deltaproteobacteria bacterium]MBM4298511.1 hypothetical protein [Deltaproteobacteria bacterium]